MCVCMRACASVCGGWVGGSGVGNNRMLAHWNLEAVCMFVFCVPATAINFTKSPRQTIPAELDILRNPCTNVTSALLVCKRPSSQMYTIVRLNVSVSLTL